ncbi:MAG: hypothetical protein IJB96_06770 [Lachnospira sp.]|nr:hypothetical protein [Lachnospira sp.]
MHLLLPYFIILIVVIQLKLRKSSRNDEKSIKKFWERESQANSVRKKNIDSLDYITIPRNMEFEKLETSDSDIIKLKTSLLALRDKKILNLTGYTNTDIKMEYGVGNLTDLSQYDDNYAELTRLISNLGKLLIERGYTNAAIELLEYGITCKTDVSTNYTLLADYYRENNEPEKIKMLTHTAKGLNSINKDVILRKLED